jgi:hypothetical protein
MTATILPEYSKFFRPICIVNEFAFEIMETGYLRPFPVTVGYQMTFNPKIAQPG